MSEEYAQHVWHPYVLTGDYAYWTSQETKALAEELGIIFVGFKELQKLQARNWNLSAKSPILGSEPPKQGQPLTRSPFPKNDRQ